MRKTLSRIGLMLAVAGFFLTWGAIGGLECDRCTWEQFFKTLLYSVPMLGIGVSLTRLWTL